MRHAGDHHRTASEDLARSLIPKNYCVEDCNYLLDYYRLTADNRRRTAAAWSTARATRMTLSALWCRNC
ncbi:hypothetical protein ACLK2F_07325 [Escherichia coli]